MLGNNILTIMRSKRIISREMLRDTEQIRAAFCALGEKMQFRQCQPLGVVICGGAALNVMGLIARPTIDADVLALVLVRGGEVSLEAAPDMLPADVRECIAEVSDDLGLGRQQWLNTGPRDLFAKGLPEGLAGRLKPEDFGPRLRVYWVARADAVCFKLYAAAARGPREDQHYEDLKGLAPTEEELRRAVDWVKQQNSDEDFKEELRRLLRLMEHEDLAYYI